MTVSIKIKNSQIITGVFLKKIVESIDKDQSNGFFLKLQFDSTTSSSKIIVMEYGEEEIKLTRHGENDDELKIEGGKEGVIQFVKLILLHGTMIFSEELCKGLFWDETLHRFKDLMKENLQNAIGDAFDSCQRTS
ncbi:MAG: hypothetical protein D6732_12760 [Methanobacteriota archaeon]|nr:MAG: hypothetical protein D6732_12760 [Euryarchaeota archaeon]